MKAWKILAIAAYFIAVCLFANPLVVIASTMITAAALFAGIIFLAVREEAGEFDE